MELNQLECFLQVAKTEHITQAAEQLHMTQPSLSKVISRLEEDLDCILFRRERGGMVLTDEGEIYYEAFSHMEDTLTAAREKADRLRTDAATLTVASAGPVKPGITISVTSSWMTPAYLRAIISASSPLRASRTR